MLKNGPAQYKAVRTHRAVKISKSYVRLSCHFVSQQVMTLVAMMASAVAVFSYLPLSHNVKIPSKFLIMKYHINFAHPLPHTQQTRLML